MFRYTSQCRYFAVVGCHSAPERAQHEVAAKKKEKVRKGNRQPGPFAMLNLDQPFQKIVALHRVGRVGINRP